MPVSPGTRLGSYEVLVKLGEGGMGEVYRARDTKLGREVALKILPEAFATDADRLMRFEREARTLASLNHPHIAQVLDLASGDVRTIFEGGGSMMRPVSDDYLGFLLEGRVMVVPFEARTNTVPAGATSRDTGVRATAFDVFADGSLVYANSERTLDAAPRRSLTWVDRAGRETAIPGEAGPGSPADLARREPRGGGGHW